MSSFKRSLCFVVALIFAGWSSAAAQQSTQGFATERFYPSPPGSGWFVMDDLNMSGGLGGAVSLSTGYSRRLSIVSDEAFVDVGVAGTYGRYRVYLNFPMPLLVTGENGVPSLSVGSNPDAISDTSAGFDVRLLGTPSGSIRLGVGGELILPSGDRGDYVSDGTYRGMFRLLGAGDAGHFSYAGQIGLHVRPLNEAPVPNSPNGNEFLFGLSAGRRMPLRGRWEVLVGPEFYGETAFQSFLNKQETGVEGLLTGRLERTGNGPRIRLKLGAGHGIVQHFGAPQWRVVFGVELFGHRPANTDSSLLP